MSGRPSMMQELYAPFTRTGAPIMMMDTASAELCKYAANSILATRISFMNEIANVCELVGADVDQVRKAIGVGSPHRHVVPVSRRRLRRQLLSEGREGAAASRRRTRATTSRSCEAVEAVNDAQKSRLVEKMEAHFGELRGPDDRALGPGVQAADRRHARGAGDHDHRAAARRWARPCAPTIRKPADTARRIFGDRIALCEKSYDALAGADALAIVTEWNEFREPDFERMRAAAEVAGRLRRPQHLLARADARARLHLLLHWPLSRAASWSPAAPATSAATPARRCSRAGYRVVVFDNLVAGHREAVRYGELVEGDITDVAAVRQALREHADLGGHALRGVSRRRRVGARAGALLPQQRRRRAERARGDGGRVGARSSSSRRPARPTASRSRRRSPKRIRSSPINSYGETKLAVERALPHFERAYGLRSVALRYFNAAGADPDGELGEDHSPEIHLIPRAIDAATGGPRPAGVRRRLPDAGRHLPARLHSRLRSGRRARQGARGARRDRRVGGLQSRHGHAAFGARGDRRRRARDGPAGAVDAGAAPARAIRRCCTRRRTRRRPSCDWTAAIAGSRRDRPHGLGLAPSASARLSGDDAFVNDASPAPPPVPLRAAVSRRGSPGRWSACCVYAAGSAGLAALIKPILDNVLPNQRAARAHRPGRIVGLYLLKGIGLVRRRRT